VKVPGKGELLREIRSRIHVEKYMAAIKVFFGEDTTSCLQDPATGPYNEPGKIIPFSLKTILVFSTQLC
jgi:hypothetical protein